MPAGYPKMTVQGSKTIFTFRFTKFTSEALYDPVIAPQESEEDTTTTTTTTIDPTEPTPTPSPTNAPTPAPAGTVVAGSVTADVPDTTPYLTPGSTQDALKGVWASAIAGSSSVEASDVTVVFSAGRRLARTLRRLGSGPLNVDYEIFVPEGEPVADVLTAITGVTAAELSAKVVENIKASTDLPSSIIASADQLQVTGATPPVTTPVGGLVTTTTLGDELPPDSSARDLVAFSLAHLMGIAALFASFSA